MLERISSLAERVSVRGPVAGILYAAGGSIIIGSVPIILALSIDFGFLAPIAMLIGLPIVAIMVLLGAIFIGLPYFLILSFLKLESSWAYGLGGMLLGSFMLLGGAPTVLDFIVKAAGGVYGGICGLLWWFLYRKPTITRRRDGEAVP